ncbi:hypothetical protein D3C87_1845200 [compost metagenome]
MPQNHIIEILGKGVASHQRSGDRGAYRRLFDMSDAATATIHDDRFELRCFKRREDHALVEKRRLAVAEEWTVAVNGKDPVFA